MNLVKCNGLGRVSQCFACKFVRSSGLVDGITWNVAALFRRALLLPSNSAKAISYGSARGALIFIKTLVLDRGH